MGKATPKVLRSSVRPPSISSYGSLLWIRLISSSWSSAHNHLYHHAIERRSISGPTKTDLAGGCTSFPGIVQAAHLCSFFPLHLPCACLPAAFFDLRQATIKLAIYQSSIADDKQESYTEVVARATSCSRTTFGLTVASHSYGSYRLAPNWQRHVSDLLARLT